MDFVEVNHKIWYNIRDFCYLSATFVGVRFEMQGKILPKITIDKPSKERILQLIRVFLYTVGFTGIILHLNEYDNMVSQAF